MPDFVGEDVDLALAELKEMGYPDADYDDDTDFDDDRVEVTGGRLLGVVDPSLWGGCDQRPSAESPLPEGKVTLQARRDFECPATAEKR